MATEEQDVDFDDLDPEQAAHLRGLVGGCNVGEEDTTTPEIVPRLRGDSPSSYDLEAVYRDVPNAWYANNRLPCCVISTRASMQAYFEYIEHSSETAYSRNPLIATDAEVSQQYFIESGGKANVGLVLGVSLYNWQCCGWTVRSRNYKIQSFGKVGKTDREAIKAAIINYTGLACGVMLPRYTAYQYAKHEPWVFQAKPKYKGNWGGHALHIIGYTPTMLKARTWNTAVYMDWAFLKAYCHDLYAVTDEREPYP